MNDSLSKLCFVEKSQTPQGFYVTAVLSGDIHPLSTASQQLISQGILGEGVLIEVSGHKMVAPFDGVITEFPGSCHRIQLKSNNGIKLTIVFDNFIDRALGLGFTPLVTQGQKVARAQPMLNFNLQQLHKLSQPCYCAVLVNNAEQLGQLYCNNKKVTAGEDILLTLTAKPAATPP